MKNQNLTDINSVKIPREERYTKPENSVYTIELEKRDLICYLREPNRKDISSVLPLLSGKKKDIVGAGEIILRNCFMLGDDEFLNDDKVILTAAIQCAALIQIEEATLKKN